MASFQFSFGPTGGPKKEEQTLHLGVLADLSGQAADPPAPVASRKFLEIDIDNFDERLERIGPRLAFQVPNSVTGKGELAVVLAFKSLDDFGPGPVTAQVGLLGKLWAAREKLARMRSKPQGADLQGKPQLRALLSQALDDAELVQAIIPAADAPQAPEAPTTAEAPASGLSELDQLLGLKPGEGPQRRPSSPVQGIIEQALAGTSRISDQAVQSLGALIDRLDEVYGQQLTLVLRHDAFKTLEATWRGLFYLVTNVETDEELKIRVLDVSKADLASALREAESPLLPKLRHEPFGCLMGDYYFDHRGDDVAILGGMAALAAAVDLPFVTAAAPSLLGLAAWRQLRVTADLGGVLEDAAHADWRRLAASGAAERLFLTMPRFLARLPYGRKTNPADGVEFEEKVNVNSPADFAWCNAAYGVGVVVARAFREEGWDARIAGGGEASMIESLPVLAYTDRHGDTEMMCPTEVSLTVDAGMILTRVGLTPLLHMKNSDRAIFAYAPTLRRPAR